MIRGLVVPALVGMAGYYAVLGGEFSALDVRQIRAEAQEAGAALERLGKVTDSLSLRAERLEHDPRTLERLARENFGMIREGEVLYRFPDMDEDESDGP